MNVFSNRIAVALKSLVAVSLLLAGSAFAADRVDINTASAQQLDAALVNIGPSKAQAIVDYRKSNGAFKNADELALVKGIGLKTVEKNRDRIAVGTAASAPKPAAKPALASGDAKPQTLPRR